MRRVLNKGEVIVYEFLVPKKENLDGNQVRLRSCGILPFSSLVVGAFPGFPGRFVTFLCFFVDVAPHPRILCTRICEFSTATACVLPPAFFSLYSEFISGQDALHTVLNSLYMHTLACKARPSFDRCGTSLSVSLTFPYFANHERMQRQLFVTVHGT